MALVAGRWPLAPLWLAAGLLVLAGSAVAGRFPGQALAGLLALVLLQDPVVAAGLTPLQMADEAMVILAMAGLAWQALRCGRLVRTPLDLPSLGFLLAALLSAAVRQVPAWIAALGVLSLAKGLAVFHLAARLPRPPAGGAARPALAVRTDRGLRCGGPGPALGRGRRLSADGASGLPPTMAGH
ncbi:MAG: hypothetical protein IPJ58_11830 [Ardenticatenia bacterium]|nr:hypothetical protein [Ardenticatenia bacterium]